VTATAKTALALLGLALLLACAPTAGSDPATATAAPVVDAPPVLPIQIVARYPHDPRAFTEGLLFHDGHLYESTGQEGESEVRRVSLATGRPDIRVPINRRQFGEGLALWRDQLISLTWTDGVAWRWQLPGITPVGQSRYDGQGWGLAANDRHLIQSNGSAWLAFRDPDSFAVERLLRVHAAGRPVDQLNELEVIDGRIWANIWMTDRIAIIDPADGRVTAYVDLSPLVHEVAADDYDAVANGIAYDAASGRLFVTGKLWPTLFEIRVPALRP